MSVELEYCLGLLIGWVGLIYVVVRLFMSLPDDTAYIVTDYYGAIYGGGEFTSEAAAIAVREELLAHGIECWVVTIDRGSYEEDQC